MRAYITTAAAVCVAGILGGVGACATSSATPETSGTTASGSVGTTATGTTMWSATLNPESGTNISGTSATVVGTNNTRATINISGATAGDVHPWHIHIGQCGDNGPIAGPAPSYHPLTVGTDGTATGSASLPMSLAAGTKYYVNVHKSSSDMGTIVSCGNLTQTGM